MDVLDMEKVIDHRPCSVYFVNPGKGLPFTGCLCRTCTYCPFYCNKKYILSAQDGIS